MVFDCGRILLHADGAVYELESDYELAEFVRSVAATWQAVLMWKRYPPATDVSQLNIPEL